ncbi:hypothetical protein GCM10025868_10960 [Angustibacter aerolatus]|uniref:ABC transmembrane type-1 domain-containing protein n=1 Tax=Angustibacter aerolatus TaxID=1162965 RepID=A0ABQ6JE33_9ACTN|nr:ABC transporter permease subunit [Angustibacter aerolatus]GMA85846.1 hypothetical protein GCM10025868_10960 [Angustibacter aerolatus]
MFWRAVLNTLLFTLGTVPVGMALGLGVALLLDGALPGRALYRSIVFLPLVISGVATGVLGSWLFDQYDGFVNDLLRAVGLGGPSRQSNGTWAMVSVIVMTVWVRLGFDMLIYLAGLQGIDRQLLEAARVDGAGWWQRLRRIVVPLLGPSTFFLLVMNLLYSFQVFDTVYAMTGGGPANSTTMLVTYAYRTGFDERGPGQARLRGRRRRRHLPGHARHHGRAVAGLAHPGPDVVSAVTAPSQTPRARRRGRGQRVARLVAAIAVTLVMFFPLYWMVVTAFSTRQSLYAPGLHLWPSQFTFDNFVTPIRAFPVWHWFRNSVVIAVLVTAITAVVNLLAGYAFAKLPFRGRNVLFLLLLSTMMIPIQAIMVPQFDLVIDLGLYGTIWAVVLPTSAAVFGIFLARQFFLSIPDEPARGRAGRRRVAPAHVPAGGAAAVEAAGGRAGAADVLGRVERLRLAAGGVLQQQRASSRSRWDWSPTSRVSTAPTTAR